jgi:hypothetical protein
LDLVFRNRQFAVFDNVVPTHEFTLLWHYIQYEDFRFVHQSEWQKIYRLSDGFPLEGPGVISEESSNIHISELSVFPTNTAIDILISLLKRESSRFEEWIGVMGTHWTVLTARSFLFPQGAGLSWHRDQKGRTGSYTFYAHPCWNVQWAGELLVADESVKNLEYPRIQLYGVDEPKVVGAHLENAFENEKLLDVGVGHYIFPKPNRLVIMAAGNLHRISKASPAAGDNVRCSISGFFLDIVASGNVGSSDYSS